MEHRDYYRILGVAKNADQDTIRKAYRKLAREYHPDLNPDSPDAEQRFKEIGEAYAVLSDPDKRKKYDKFGVEWEQYEKAGIDPDDFRQSRAGSAGGFGWFGEQPRGFEWRSQDPGFSHGGEDIFGDGVSDIFGSLFGQDNRSRGRTGHRRRPSQDVETSVEVTLAEAFHGTSRTVMMPDGRRIEVRIPPGVETGSRVRAGGALERGAGNLFLRINVLPDPRFRREGDDLYVPVSVDLYTAVLGGEVQVPTLERPVALKIPAGTQNGRRIRLRGQGMPRLRNPDQRGDLYAEINVRMPAKISGKERQLFEELRSMQSA